MPNNIEINIANELGFCSGVKRAINKAKQACAEYGQVQMLGDIVHNEIVVNDLEERGVKVIDSLDNIDESIPLLFRAHGTPEKTWEKAEEKGLKIIDATCPLVKDIHTKAKELAKEGRQIIIIGDKNHEEVEGISSQVNDPMIIDKIDDIPEKHMDKVGVVIQSTQNISEVEKKVGKLIRKVEDLRIYNTICAPTRNRQKEVKKLARNNDLVIIVGSFSSANTKRLTEVAGNINSNTHQVSRADDLKKEWFDDVDTVGLSAGASTPEKIIEEVKNGIVLI